MQSCQSMMANLGSKAPPRKYHNNSQPSHTSAGSRSPQRARSLPPKVGARGERGQSSCSTGLVPWCPQWWTGSADHATVHYLPSWMLAARAHAAPAVATSTPGTQGWPQAAGRVSQPGARNILLQQGDPSCEDFVCHVPATGEPRGPAPCRRSSPVPRTSPQRTPNTANKWLLVTAPVPCPLPRGSCQASPRVHVNRRLQLCAAADIGGVTAVSSSGRGRAGEPSAVPVPAPQR